MLTKKQAEIEAAITKGARELSLLTQAAAEAGLFVELDMQEVRCVCGPQSWWLITAEVSTDLTLKIQELGDQIEELDRQRHELDTERGGLWKEARRLHKE